jgi:Cdc6-like AAA superfamily ATPase
MLKDYDAILKAGFEFPVCTSIFENNENDKIYQNDELFQLSHSGNLIQKLGIINSFENNVLIYGPPGTGKSDVVGNIICNAIYKNKNVISVSEKKSALDVISTRIGELSLLTLGIFDNSNTNDFYDRIIKLNELLKTENICNLNPVLDEYKAIINY